MFQYPYKERTLQNGIIQRLQTKRGDKITTIRGQNDRSRSGYSGSLLKRVKSKPNSSITVRIRIGQEIH